MKIGIYKPFKKVFFHDDKEDNAAWSYEIVHVAKILAERGHEIYMLSETDLQDGIFENIRVGTLDERYDRIILWSGTFKSDVHGEGIIQKLRALTDRFDFMLTDLRLVPEDKQLYDMFDKIYTQATAVIPGIPAEKQIYGGVAQFLPYKHEWKLSVDESIKKKFTEFYFGGTERGRLDDFIEYVWRPYHVITTKTAFFGLDNRCTRQEYMVLLDSAKFSIVIADVEYNQNHFVTPRPYEHFMHDIVGFVDHKFDPDGTIIPLDSFLRVKNYKEMREKIAFLSRSPEEYKNIIEWGRAQIKPEHISGDYVYGIIE